MEMNKQPLEFEAIPQEHSIPLEYPQYVPTPKKKKKGVNAMLVYAFAGVFVLYMAFGYLFPSHPNYNEEFGGGDYGNGDYGGGDYGGGDSGALDNPGDLPTGADQEVFLNYQEDFEAATAMFLDDDYVGAATAVAESLRFKFTSYSGEKLDGTNMVYRDGTLSAFDGEDVTGNQGAYLWIQEKTVYYEDDKDGTIYPEQNMVISLVRLGEKTGKTTQVTILQMNIPLNNLYYGYMYSSVSCLQAELDDDFSGEKGVLTTFTISLNDYGADESLVRGNYAVYGTSRVEGAVNRGAFTGQVIYRNDGLKLNESKTQLQITEEYAGYGWMYVLNDSGVLTPDAKEYADLNDYTHGTQEFTDKWNEAVADPDVYGIWYKQGGEWPTLYLKNLSDADNAWTYYAYEWYEPSFPIADILTPWAVLKQHI